MKISELQQAIEEIIIEILSPEEQKAKASAIASSREDIKDATNDLRTATTPIQKRAAQDQLNLAKKDLAQAGAMTEAEDEDDDSTLDDKTSDKNAAKSAKEEEKKNKEKRKKLDDIVKAYKEIAGEIKEKIKAANSGNKEAMDWIKSKQSIIKAYNKAKKIN